MDVTVLIAATSHGDASVWLNCNSKGEHMKKVLLGLALAAGTLGAVGAANAATVYAQSVVEVTPGVRPVTPAPVDYVGPDRYTPENVLGAPDSTFYSLGRGGSIVLDFGRLVRSPGTAIEVTFNRVAGGIGLESFDIYVSATLDFLDAAVASLTNEAGTPGPRGLTQMISFGNASFQYVKLVDTTPASSGSPDGIDIESIGFSPVPVPAAGLLLGGALLGAGALRRRKAKKA